MYESCNNCVDGVKCVPVGNDGVSECNDFNYVASLQVQTCTRDKSEFHSKTSMFMLQERVVYA